MKNINLISTSCCLVSFGHERNSSAENMCAYCFNADFDTKVQGMKRKKQQQQFTIDEANFKLSLDIKTTKQPGFRLKCVAVLYPVHILYMLIV